MTTLGSDPEIAFVGDRGNVIPSGVVFDACKHLYEYHPEVPGVPELDIPPKGSYLVVDRDRRMRLYADGMSCEFNLGESEDSNEVVDEFHELYLAAKECADSYGCSLEVKPFIPVTQRDIELGGVTCAQFGCDPDHSIYSDEFDPARVDARNHMARYFGCHLHSGMSPEMEANGGLLWVENNIKSIVTANDFFVGIPNVIVASGEDSRLRRNVYGRAGRYRIQVPYGWEYRTPDNHIMRSPWVLKAFLEFTRSATDLAYDTEELETMLNQLDYPTQLFDVINGCDYQAAVRIWNDISVPVLRGGMIDTELIYAIEEITQEGFENTDYYKFIEEWGLD